MLTDDEMWLITAGIVAMAAIWGSGLVEAWLQQRRAKRTPVTKPTSPPGAK